MLTDRSAVSSTSRASAPSEVSLSTRAVLARIAASRILPAALVRPGRSQAIASIVAHAGAGCTLRVLSLVADAGLVLFAIDDLLDESDIDLAEKRLRVAQYTDVARGIPCPEVCFDPVARAIASLRDRLADGGCDAALLAVWSDAVARMLAGMGAELPGVTPPPTLGAYLASARDSIGVEMVALTAFLAMDPAGTGASLPALRRAERHLSTAVRLANDLRTCERERVEGRANAVTLVGDAGVPRLRGRCARSLTMGRVALTRDGVADTAQGRFLLRFAEALVAMYAARDFEQAAA